MGRLMPGATSYACRLPPRSVATDPGGPAEKVIRRVAAMYDPVNGVAGTVSVIFWAHNPSPRLRWSISVGWELDPAAPFVAGTLVPPPTWQMRAIRVPESGGGSADLLDIFLNSSGVAAARTLPDAYEVDSAVKDVRGVLALHATSGVDIAAGLYGSLVIEARWEPHDGCYAPDIFPLLERADLRVQGIAPVLYVGVA